MPGQKLSALKVKNAKPGRYLDGQGLRLYVTDSGSKNWVYRYMMDGRSREMGLGAYPDTSLEEAREKAAKYRKLAKGGDDPIEHRKAERARKALERARRLSFEDCARQYIASHSAGWKNPKHAAQWANTLTTYAYPVIGAAAVGDIGTDEVLQVLKPIWTEKTETASRLRGRVENILDWARVMGYRTGENPARWRGHLDKLLPRRSDVAKVVNHSVLPELVPTQWPGRSGFPARGKFSTVDLPRQVHLILFELKRSFNGAEPSP